MFVAESTIKKVVELLLKMGAEVEEDFIHVTVAFRRLDVERGLQFTKRLFAPDLFYGKDGRLYYGLHRGVSFCYVRVLPEWNEADLERKVFPTAFWDSLYRMAQRLRPLVFDDGLTDVEVTWDVFREVRKRHNVHPRRETLLLMRMLRGFMEREATRRKAEAEAKNAALSHSYEELLRLVRNTPHSLNILKEKAPGAVFRKITPGYWRIDAVVDKEEFTGWGADALDAAAELLLHIEDEEKRRARMLA